MADNTLLNSGTGGDTIATDDIAGIKFQRVKVVIGNDGVNNGDISSTNPMPITSTDTPTTVVHALVTVTTAGSRVQLATNIIKSVTVKASATNTGTIYVGGSTVSSANGFPLAPGDTVSLDLSNTNIVYVDSSINAQSCNFIGNN